jgi:hypothetical protein
MDLALYFHNSETIICQTQTAYWTMGMETVFCIPFDIVALIAAPLLK